MAEFIDTVRRDLLPESKLNKARRNEICRDPVVLVKSLMNADDLGYASTGKISPTKQMKRAHKKVKRAEQIARQE